MRTIGQNKRKQIIIKKNVIAFIPYNILKKE
jgi:hypothetical protein